MSPEQQRLAEFLSKWGVGGLGYKLNERQGAQQHFVELCAVLDVPAPVGGEDYVFEKGSLALGQQRGFADVFKRGHFARAAKHLNDLRERWLNPPEWTRREPEVVPLGMDHSPYPDRILPRDGFEKQLAQRTLTKLYNERPAWLAQAHVALDAAVAAAYGWADYTPQMPDEEILRRLLALNRERAATTAA